MSLRFKSAVIILFSMLAILSFAGTAGAASVYGVLPFQNTGASPPSHYGNGANPYDGLLQASDGNFYGTTFNGGSGLCGGGCGTIFKISATTGIESVLYSFTGPDGSNPSAGLIQGKDGALYGVAIYGGLYGRCPLGSCGTLFRITMTGDFTLIHQFCGQTGCYRKVEGGNPIGPLVQEADGTLYGTSDGGTLFSATTAGKVKTLHMFAASSEGSKLGPLLLGQDGSTLYGIAALGGPAGGGTVFSYSAAAGLTVIHSFDTAGPSEPAGGLIYGVDGLLYGIANGDGTSVYSLSTTGSDFTVDATTFTSDGSYSALLLGSDGMMYGTILGYGATFGGVFVYNPITKALQPFVSFQTNTGGQPYGPLIEGKDHYLYGSNTAYGGSDSFGPDEGTLFRIGPPLP